MKSWRLIIQVSCVTKGEVECKQWWEWGWLGGRIPPPHFAWKIKDREMSLAGRQITCRLWPFNSPGIQTQSSFHSDCLIHSQIRHHIRASKGISKTEVIVDTVAIDGCFFSHCPCWRTPGSVNMQICHLLLWISLNNYVVFHSGIINSPVMCMEGSRQAWQRGGSLESTLWSRLFSYPNQK